jgi:hypothetical protein
MRIQQNTLKKITKNKKLKSRLSYELGKDIVTIRRWIKENDPKLTQALTLKIISEELELTQAQILEA